MVDTVKFSQFLPGGNLASGDYVVGLNGPPGTGTNTIWQNTGSGGGGAVTQVLPQPVPALAKGNWVRVKDNTGAYTTAQGDTAEHGEAIGIVIEANAATFTLQQSGYITTAMDVVAGLTAQQVYFLDTATAGAMVAVDATVNGQISRPVFVADSPTSGWVLPYRPMIVGGAAPSSSGGTTTDTSVVVINQNGHGFTRGTWLRVDTPPDVILNQPKYIRAVNSTLQNSQAVGVVVSPDPQNPNQFTLQFSGFNTGSVTVDDMGNPVIPNVVYYLSNTAGAITSTPPTTFSKPLYICEQTGSSLPPSNAGLNTGVYKGYILPQRPLSAPIANPNASPYIFLGRLDNNSPDGPFADANIFNNNGGPFKSYLMTFNPNVSNGHGLSATGPNPITIGFQLAAGGVFYTGTNYQCALHGVNNSAGIHTATLWGIILDTTSPINSAVIFPHLATETGTRVAISQGSFELTDNAIGGSMGILVQAYCTDWSVGNVPTNHNFAISGQTAGANGGGAGVFTSGIRLFFGGIGAAIFDGTAGYFSIWGIPNS